MKTASLICCFLAPYQHDALLVRAFCGDPGVRLHDALCWRMMTSSSSPTAPSILPSKSSKKFTSLATIIFSGLGSQVQYALVYFWVFNEHVLQEARVLAVQHLEIFEIRRRLASSFKFLFPGLQPQRNF